MGREEGARRPVRVSRVRARGHGKGGDAWVATESFEIAIGSVRALHADRGGSYARRSIARLASTGLALPHFRAAIEILGGDADDIDQTIQAVAVVTPAAVDEPAEVETFVADLYAAMSGTCKWSKLSVTGPGLGKYASVDVRVAVPYAAADVAWGIDPQSWDQCSKFFPPFYTHVAKQASGNVVLDPNSECQLLEGTPYSQGTRWSDPILEYFKCEVPGLCSTSFTNVLSIDSIPSSSGSGDYEVVYGLTTPPLCGFVLGVDEVVEADYGSLRVTRSGAETIIHSSKTVGFKSSITSGVVKAMFSVQTDELAREVAKMACCFESSKFLKQAEKRVITLSDTIDALGQAATPTEKMLGNSIGLWLDGMSYWMSLMPFPRPTLPLMIKGVAGATAAQDVSLEVDIDPPSGIVAPSATPVVLIGDATVVLAEAAAPAFGPGRKSITMTLTIPASPTAGTYAGVIHQDQTPLASVVVYVF